MDQLPLSWETGGRPLAQKNFQSSNFSRSMWMEAEGCGAVLKKKKKVLRRLAAFITACAA